MLSTTVLASEDRCPDSQAERGVNSPFCKTEKQPNVHFLFRMIEQILKQNEKSMKLTEKAIHVTQGVHCL